MSGFFFDLGRTLGSALRKGNWLLDSVTGSEEDSLRAEHEFGRELAAEHLRQTPADSDPRAARFVGAIGERLVACVRDKRRTFYLRVIQTVEANAYALPGGFVMITRPLLDLCEWNVDETAFILGHEMAHVLRGHAMERLMSEWLVGTAGRALPIGGIAGMLLRYQAADLVHRAYSRDQEFDADRIGARLARAAGFDAHAGARLLARLHAGAGPEHPLAVYFATHPPCLDRIASLNAWLREDPSS